MWLPFLLVFLTSFSELFSEERSEFCSQDRICVVYVQDETGADIYFRNQIGITNSKVTIEVNAKIKNMKSTRRLPFTTVLTGAREKKIFRLNVNNPKKKWVYQINYRWIFGDYNANHDVAAIYELPIEKGKKVRINQAYNGEKSHFGDNRYAIDFGLGEGSLVTAAREGIVVDTEDKFTEGGFDMKYINSANFIKVQHIDGTIAQYAHLKAQGVLVRRGQYVSPGQPIGYSGNTGYSDGPHLHFEVYKPTIALKKETIPTMFRTASSDAEELTEGHLHWRRDQGLPLQNFAVDPEGIRICSSILDSEGIGCNLSSYNSTAPFVIYIPIIKPSNYNIQIQLKKNGATIEPKQFRWDTKSEWWVTYLEIDLTEEDIELEGEWIASVTVNGAPVKDVNFFVQKQ